MSASYPHDAHRPPALAAQDVLTTKKKQPPKDDFDSIARALECDESEAAFDKTLGKVGTAMPEPKAVRKPARKC